MTLTDFLFIAFILKQQKLRQIRIVIFYEIVSKNLISIMFCIELDSPMMC